MMECHLRVLNVAQLACFPAKTGGLVGILDTLDIAAYVVDMEAAGKKAWLGIQWAPPMWPRGDPEASTNNKTCLE